MSRRILLTVAGLVLTGCGQPEATPPAEPASVTVLAASPVPPPVRNPRIPVEVSYPIIRDDEEYNPFSKKRMVDVRLNMKVSPEVMCEIARSEVKAQEKRQYERTFIFVYLPEPVPGVKNDPGVMCHFNPTLDVNIMGMSSAAETASAK